MRHTDLTPAAPLRRRSVLAGGFALVAAPFVMRLGAAAADTSIRVAHTSNIFDYAPMWLALRRGYFAQVGLDVSYAVLNSAPATAEKVKDGSFEIGIGAPENAVVDAEAGGELRIIGGLTHKVLGSLIVPARIASVAELRGGRLGVSSLKDGTGLLMQEVLARHGVMPGEYELKPVGIGPARWKALQAGEIEAGLQTPPLNFIAVEAGFRNLGELPDWVPAYQFLTINARRDWLERNGEAAGRFLAALARGAAAVYAERELAVALATEAMNVSRPHAELTWAAFARYRPFDPALALEPQAFAKMLATMAQVGSIPTDRVGRPERYTWTPPPRT